MRRLKRPLLLSVTRTWFSPRHFSLNFETRFARAGFSFFAALVGVLDARDLLAERTWLKGAPPARPPWARCGPFGEYAHPARRRGRLRPFEPSSLRQQIGFDHSTHASKIKKPARSSGLFRCLLKIIFFASIARRLGRYALVELHTSLLLLGVGRFLLRPVELGSYGGEFVSRPVGGR